MTSNRFRTASICMLWEPGVLKSRQKTQPLWTKQNFWGKKDESKEKKQRKENRGKGKLDRK